VRDIFVSPRCRGDLRSPGLLLILLHKYYLDIWTLENGKDMLSRNVGKKQCMPRNNSKEQKPHSPSVFFYKDREKKYSHKCID